MLTDPELTALDVAVAKAMGLSCALSSERFPPSICMLDRGVAFVAFQPSRDIAEAMRIAGERELWITFTIDRVIVQWFDSDCVQHDVSEFYKDHAGDRLRACSVAICRAVRAQAEQARIEP